jgi:hypothetical protein
MKFDYLRKMLAPIHHIWRRGTFVLINKLFNQEFFFFKKFYSLFYKSIRERIFVSINSMKRFQFAFLRFANLFLFIDIVIVCAGDSIFFRDGHDCSCGREFWSCFSLLLSLCVCVILVG